MASITPELEDMVRKIVRDEMQRTHPTSMRHGLPKESMHQAMDRIVELRKRIRVPPGEFTEILEEHRREFGRGPLVDDPGKGLA
jgi:hypothetical protein